jgi:hypothetical protein
MNIITTEILQNQKVRLQPFENEEDFEYLLGLTLTYKYDKGFPKEFKRKALELFGHLFWTLYAGDTRVGVVYTSYMPNFGYTIDGYRDDEVAKRIDNKISFSYEAIKLVTDFMLNNITDILWTTHDIRNRGATIMCKRYGYIVEKEMDTHIGRFILMVKRRN